MRGLERARIGERDEAINEVFFGGEIDRGWFAGDDATNGLRIFRRRKLLLEPFARRSPLATRLFLRFRAIQQQNHISGIAESDLQRLRSVVEDAEDSDDRRGINGFAECLIVEADVSTGDGRAKRSASLAEAVNGLRELPHHFRFFRAAEI